MHLKIPHRWNQNACVFECDMPDDTADPMRVALEKAVKEGADLRSANLRGADLGSANLRGAQNAGYAAAQTVIAPAGTLLVWKKCRNNVLVRLRIPEAAKRSNATGRKCRAEYVEVVEVIGTAVGVSEYDEKVT